MLITLERYTNITSVLQTRELVCSRGFHGLVVAETKMLKALPTEMFLNLLTFPSGLSLTNLSIIDLSLLVFRCIGNVFILVSCSLVET